jgi:hypothetical protein
MGRPVEVYVADEQRIAFKSVNTRMRDIVDVPKFALPSHRACLSSHVCRLILLEGIDIKHNLVDTLLVVARTARPVPEKAERPEKVGDANLTMVQRPVVGSLGVGPPPMSIVLCGERDAVVSLSLGTGTGPRLVLQVRKSLLNVLPGRYLSDPPTIASMLSLWQKHSRREPCPQDSSW